MNGAIYWLASYPKSGNTWIRALLTNYFSETDEPADINGLDGGAVATSRAQLDDRLGIETSNLTPTEIERLRPASFEFLSDAVVDSRCPDDQPAPPFVAKVHDAYTLTADETPLFPSRASAGVIYVMRNPIDVVPSFAHHLDAPIESVITFMANDDQMFEPRPGGLHTHVRQRLLSWGAHVSSWLDQTAIAHINVSYEQLCKDTAETLAKIVTFVGHIPDPERIARAVAHSDFDALAAQERTSGFRERAPMAPSFFRQGLVGDGYRVLTPRQIARVEADHGDVMARFGYLDKATT